MVLRGQSIGGGREPVPNRVSVSFVRGDVNNRPVLNVTVHVGRNLRGEEHLAFQHFLFALRRLQELSERPGGLSPTRRHRSNQ